MKRKIYFILNDFVKRLALDDTINLYDKYGMSKNMQFCEIQETYINAEAF